MVDVDALLRNSFQESNETNNPFVKAATSVIKKLVHQNEISYFM